MGSGAGAAGFFGGMLSGVGQGMLERSRAQQEIKTRAFEASLKTLVDMAHGVDAGTVRPDTAPDIYRATLQEIADYQGGNKAAKGAKGAKGQQANPAMHIQDLLDKTYASGEGRPQRDFDIPFSTGIAGLAGMPSKHETLPAIPEHKGAFLSEEEQAARSDQQAQMEAKRAAIKAAAIQAQAAVAEDEKYHVDLKRLTDSGVAPTQAAEILAHAPAAMLAPKPATPKAARITGSDGVTFNGFQHPDETGAMQLYKLGSDTPLDPSKYRVADTQKTDLPAEVRARKQLLVDQGSDPDEAEKQALSDWKKGLDEKLRSTQERLAQMEQDRTHPSTPINPGTREYKISQDLAYGKLRMTDFNMLLRTMGKDASQINDKKLDIYLKASELNPNFNVAKFEMGYTLAANPKVQQQLSSLDNVLSGAPGLLEASDKAKRVGSTILNKAIIPGGIAIGGQKYSDFATARTAFADELSGALGYGNASDMSREMGFDMTNASLSPENFRSAVQNIVVPFVQRKKDALLGQMGVYGEQGNNPAADRFAGVPKPSTKGARASTDVIGAYLKAAGGDQKAASEKMTADGWK
jgi:hypothetical protein